ncbi:hypothetical protein BH20ACT19_BH20ACT19_04170 [soil metagenome]
MSTRAGEGVRRRFACPSVGELIREAIDRAFVGSDELERIERLRREDALASFLAADRMPVDDWPEMEREIEELYERAPSAR